MHSIIGWKKKSQFQLGANTVTSLMGQHPEMYPTWFLMPEWALLILSVLVTCSQYFTDND